MRADVEESYIDRVRIGDTLTVRLPSGVEREGTVFYRGADAGFATQRDVSRTKRDIKTFEIRLRVDNKDRRLAVGMTAYVLLPVVMTGSSTCLAHERCRPWTPSTSAASSRSSATSPPSTASASPSRKARSSACSGPNGAGKSTLIRMLVTLLPPTAGTALVNGFDVVKQSDGVRQSIGVIPQAMTSDLELSVEENLIIFAKLYSVPRAKRERLIDELLEAVELTQWRKAQVKNLSGGMRRRVEIARGLVHEPRIFFLDEPTTGLDPVSRVAVWEMLGEDQARAQPHHPDHHALHGRSRQAVRSHRDRRSRRAEGARFAAQAEGVDSRQELLEVSFSATPPDWQAARSSGCPASSRVTAHDNIFRHRHRQRSGDDAGADGAGGGAPASPCSRCRCRARRSTTCSCTTRAGRCATRCRKRTRCERGPLLRPTEMRRVKAETEN